MRLYRLTEDEVTEALQQPERVTPTSHGEQHAWKQIPRGWLRVTYTQQDQVTVVITGVFCPTPRKGIFQGDTIGTSSGVTETGQRCSDHIYLKFQ